MRKKSHETLGFLTIDVSSYSGKVSLYRFSVRCTLLRGCSRSVLVVTLSSYDLVIMSLKHTSASFSMLYLSNASWQRTIVMEKSKLYTC